MKIWYQKCFQARLFALLLSPFSLLYRIIIYFRRLLFRLGLKKTTYFPVPLIVVGNITVGGNGKTPLVIALVEFLKTQGFKPGLVSRGYKGKAPSWPQVVEPDNHPEWYGDEPVMLVKKTDCPMVVGPDRVAAVKALLEKYDCDVVISDDGLQHYAMGRDIEIAVIDGERRFGNGFCLPAGPLREPQTRLRGVDFTVCNGNSVYKDEYSMQLVAGDFYQLINPKNNNFVTEKTVHAVAGIGYPKRFFQQVVAMGYTVVEHPFPDHHDYTVADFDFLKDDIVIMTEKDAVKCLSFADERFWCLPVKAVVSDVFLKEVANDLAP